MNKKTLSERDICTKFIVLNLSSPFSMPASGPVNHVFVDFENVQQVDLAGFGDRVVKVTLLLGEKQKRLEADLVQQLLDHAAHVHLVRLTSSGRNALDFALTYYLGRAVAGDPTGFFHVVSKDKGFDPLIVHLKVQHVKIARHDAFAGAVAQIASPPATAPIREPRRAVPLPTTTAPTPTPVAPPAPDAPLADIFAHLARNLAHRPGRREKLRAVLQNKFHSSDAQTEKVIDQLIAQGAVSIDGNGKVMYPAFAS